MPPCRDLVAVVAIPSLTVALGRILRGEVVGSDRRAGSPLEVPSNVSSPATRRAPDCCRVTGCIGSRKMQNHCSSVQGSESVAEVHMRRVHLRLAPCFTARGPSVPGLDRPGGDRRFEASGRVLKRVLVNSSAVVRWHGRDQTCRRVEVVPTRLRDGHIAVVAVRPPGSRAVHGDRCTSGCNRRDRNGGSRNRAAVATLESDDVRRVCESVSVRIGEVLGCIDGSRAAGNRNRGDGASWLRRPVRHRDLEVLLALQAARIGRRADAFPGATALTMLVPDMGRSHAGI